ncbi:hypothetical protein Glove_33g107 [Diversispora epigaea]|uniref:Uncharacterized protein n=1 Tax=Diversispora epigaea TaxID=1348612 RepID=A0A397JRP7_9GLOM|nr:hypothetical protein Glove_33g107 [Diversispora epigaea]
MSRNFQRSICENYYSNLNGLFQHLKRFKQSVYYSTEESNEKVSEIISDINDMSLDSEEFQSVLESLPRENPSQDLYEFEECEEYDGDISLISQPNMIQDSEMFEEPENSELVEEVLQSQDNEEPRNSELVEERFQTYDDLMTLVTKHNLNNKAGNAIIKFFNKHSNVPVSPFPKILFLRGKNYMENNILETDATILNTLGKSSLHLIYISLSNILTWQRNKEDAKQLLGYLPIISAKDESEKKSSEFKILVCKTFHNSIKFLLEPLFKNASIDLKIDGKRIWFYSRISTVICNWPEACTFSLTYKSSN